MINIKTSTQWPKGCLQLYTGNGKGKTTAAFGLALRAAGYNKRSYIGQFMKGIEYGEIPAVALLSRWITVEQYGSSECLSFSPTPDPSEVARAEEGLSRAREAMESGEYDLVILDEASVATYFHLLTDEALLQFADHRPGNVELIITGRYASERLIERADLVTEMQEIKHPYASGLAARDGIER